MDFAEIIPRIERDIDASLKPRRAAHSRRVAGLAAEICGKFGLDALAGHIAGLGHDLCKGMAISAQRDLASALAARFPERPWASACVGCGAAPDAQGPAAGVDSGLQAYVDQVVHGPAAAELLAGRYGVDREDILEAVALHSTGFPGMGALAAAVFVADKTEPGRDDAAPAGALSVHADLRSLLASAVSVNIAWLRERGLLVAPCTLDLYNSLQPEDGER